MKAMQTVSHDKHKGMGGNPAGDRSAPELMLLLCKWRHQDAPISRDRETLLTKYLSDEKNDGPIQWLIDTDELGRLAPSLRRLLPTFGGFVELATEIEPFVYEPLAEWQAAALELLAGLRF